MTRVLADGPVSPRGSGRSLPACYRPLPVRRPPEIRALARLALGCGLVGASSACFAPPGEAQEEGRDRATDAAPTPAESPARTASAPANGWGDEIAWRTLEEGRREAQQLDRPLMLIVWTTWCSKCRALKQSFAANPEIHALSREFVMVNADQDALPEVSEHAPDGDYIPRLIFFGADGRVDEGVVNDARQSSIYFYSPVDDVAAKMRLALERHAQRS